MVYNPLIATQPFEAQAQLLKVLTVPVRLAILNLLRHGEHCVCHMEAHLGCQQTFLLQQLAALRDAGLILDRRDGGNIYYRVVEPRILPILAGLEQIIPSEHRRNLDELDELEDLDVHEVDCPCPECNCGS